MWAATENFKTHKPHQPHSSDREGLKLVLTLSIDVLLTSPNKKTIMERGTRQRTKKLNVQIVIISTYIHFTIACISIWFLWIGFVGDLRAGLLCLWLHHITYSLIPMLQHWFVCWEFIVSFYIACHMYAVMRGSVGCSESHFAECKPACSLGQQVKKHPTTWQMHFFVTVQC